MKHLLLTLLLITLTGCNLSASLLGGSGEVTIHKAYEHRGEEHAIEIVLKVKDEIVEDVVVTPAASSRAEEMVLMAFAANVRAAWIGKSVTEITVPESVKEKRLRDVLTDVIAELN